MCVVCVCVFISLCVCVWCACVCVHWSVCVCVMCEMSVGDIILFTFQVFDDAYKSELSCIIVDDMERVMGMSSCAPQYNPTVLLNCKNAQNTCHNLFT